MEGPEHGRFGDGVRNHWELLNLDVLLRRRWWYHGRTTTFSGYSDRPRCLWELPVGCLIYGNGLLGP